MMSAEEEKKKLEKLMRRKTDHDTVMDPKDLPVMTNEDEDVWNKRNWEPRR
jgi:hypothetical protein